MNQSKLETLKQAWAASGAIEDEAAYLRERVLQREVSLERLGLAGECGHPAARMALGLEDAQLTATAWLDTVCARGVEVCSRLAVAAAGVGVEQFEAGPLKQSLKRAIDDLEFYLYGTPGESQLLPRATPCPEGLVAPRDDGWRWCPARRSGVGRCGRRPPSRARC